MFTWQDHGKHFLSDSGERYKNNVVHDLGLSHHLVGHKRGTTRGDSFVDIMV